MLKLFAFEGVETDWVAAPCEAEARDFLKRHAGLNDEDIAYSYESVSELDPASVELYTDEVDAETEETIMITAAEMMAGKSRPFLVASTYE